MYYRPVPEDKKTKADRLIRELETLRKYLGLEHENLYSRWGRELIEACEVIAQWEKGE